VGCVKECFCACPCWFSLCAVVCLLRGGTLQLLLVSFSVGCVYFVCLYRGWEGFVCCELFVCSCRLHTHDDPRVVVALTSFLLL
jgi:hypothetical protein